MSSTPIIKLPYTRINEVRHLWCALVEHQLRLTPHLATRARLVEESWRRRLAFEAMWREREPRNFVLAAERDGDLVGYAFVRVIEDELAASWIVSVPRAELSALSVLPDVRDTGVGRALMASVYAELRRLGIADMTIDVITTNIDAIRFYEREGAVPFHTTFLLTVGTDDTPV
jgi:GNAT superfamily N-acetyltransferase